MIPRLELAPVRLSRAMIAEIVVRLAIAVFLVGVGLTDPDGGIALLMCVLGALYHLYVAGTLAACRLAAATHLTLDASGLTLRQAWRERRIAWPKVIGITVPEARALTARRAWPVVTLGDHKGPTEAVPIPDVFGPGRYELAAEMERRRLACG